MKKTILIAVIALTSCQKQTTQPITVVEAKEQVTLEGRYLRTYTIINGETNAAFEDSVIITSDKIYIDYNGKGVTDETLSYTIENNKMKVKNRLFDIALGEKSLRLSETKSSGLVVEGWVMVR